MYEKGRQRSHQGVQPLVFTITAVLPLFCVCSSLQLLLIRSTTPLGKSCSLSAEWIQDNPGMLTKR